MDNNNNIPYNYKPLSPWAYFGYQLLFTIPLIGFIFLLVFAFNNDNIIEEILLDHIFVHLY